MQREMQKQGPPLNHLPAKTEDGILSGEATKSDNFGKTLRLMEMKRCKFTTRRSAASTGMSPYLNSKYGWHCLFPLTHAAFLSSDWLTCLDLCL